MQRTHPAQRPRAPTHGFRPREVADRALQNLGHDIGGGTALFLDHGEIDLTLFIVANLKLIHAETG